MKKITFKDAPAAELRYRGELIHHGKDGMVSLTDMWKAAGSPPNQSPPQYLRLAGTQELVRLLSLNMGVAHVFKQKSGKHGGTWAHPFAAVSYANYLSPEFRTWAQQEILARLQGMASPATDRRAHEIEKWVRRGKTLAWATRRVDGKDVRHKFTDALKAHGINEAWQYGQCTNEIYKGILGHDKNGVLLERNLPAKANLRDHLEAVENAAVSLGEALAENNISDGEMAGIRECREACKMSSESVRISLEKNREFIANYRKMR